MLEYIEHGNILESPSEALVCPVNCVGIMGAGLAKQFREAYPQYYSEYAAACNRGRMSLGNVLVYSTNTHIPKDLSHDAKIFRKDLPLSPSYILSFPTKNHWKEKSSLQHIEHGLYTLQEEILFWEIHSIAIPAIGCGLGGLPWNQVYPLIERTIKRIEQDKEYSIHARIYPPEDVPSSEKEGG